MTTDDVVGVSSSQVALFFILEEEGLRKKNLGERERERERDPSLVVMAEAKCNLSGEDVLILVLCFILPCVGVYIKGKKFDANFWLSLVLMIFVITYPLAIIFALLYFFKIFEIA